VLFAIRPDVCRWMCVTGWPCQRLLATVVVRYVQKKRTAFVAMKIKEFEYKNRIAVPPPPSSLSYLLPIATMSIIKNSYTVGGLPEKLIAH